MGKCDCTERCLTAFGMIIISFIIIAIACIVGLIGLIVYFSLGYGWEIIIIAFWVFVFGVYIFLVAVVCVDDSSTKRGNYWEKNLYSERTRTIIQAWFRSFSHLINNFSINIILKTN